MMRKPPAFDKTRTLHQTAKIVVVDPPDRSEYADHPLMTEDTVLFPSAIVGDPFMSIKGGMYAIMLWSLDFNNEDFDRDAMMVRCNCSREMTGRLEQDVIAAGWLEIQESDGQVTFLLKSEPGIER